MTDRVINNPMNNLYMEMVEKLIGSGISVNLKEAMEHIEYNLILLALIKCDFNNSKASVLLNINRTTLIEKIKLRRMNRDSEYK